MKSNKIITKFISKGLIVAATLGLIPGSIALAETTNQSNNNDTSNVSVDTTTGAAVTVNDNDSDTQVDNANNVDLDSQYSNAKEALNDFKATNSTSKDDILDSIRDSVDSSINVSFVDGTFSKTKASEVDEGEITGTITIKSEDQSRDLEVNLAIEKLNNDQVQVDEETTGAEVAVTTSAAVVDENEPTSLQATIEGTIAVGQTIEDDVIGYNASGEQVDLNKDYISYEWFADGKEVGESEDLTITQDLVGKGINCEITYNDGKGDK